MSSSSDAASTAYESIVSMFDAVCMALGDENAIVGAQNVGYTELQYASLALARQLVHRYRPTCVLVDLQQHVAAEAVALLACMRIQVPFVPVVIDNGLQRIVNMLRQTPGCNLAAVVTCKNDNDPILVPLAQAGVHNVVYVNETGDLMEPMTVPDSLPTTYNDDLYILFTSGTVSNPKAVIGSQSSTIRRLKWFASEFPSQPDTIVARRSPLTFVDSITELFSALLFAPAKLYAFEPGYLNEKGLAAIFTTPCTRVTMLPSQLDQVLLLSALQHSMELVIVSGEPCPEHVVTSFRAKFPTTTLLNLYGQTETTGDVAWANLSERTMAIVDHVVPIGRPLPGVTISATKQGELLVSGNLSNGYLDGPSFTANTTFHTGDVGFCIDGCWYVQGRINDRTKIHGVWSCPVQVEAAVQQVFGISCVAVTLDQTVYALTETPIPFSREKMRDAGIPWNLIPKQVFCHTIPTSDGGAGKVDRSRVKQTIRERLQHGGSGTTMTSTDMDPVLTILAKVLGASLPVPQKSFVELGGDSALAVTFLYHLRRAKLVTDNVTAKDILSTETLSELRSVLAGEPTLKRIKVEESKPFEFIPKEIERLGSNHKAAMFAACVDSSPLVVHGQDDSLPWLYCACQNGIIQRVVDGSTVSGCYNLDGWKVQASLIVMDYDETLIVCGCNPEEETGIVVALDLNLSITKWKRMFSGMIKSTPVSVDMSVYVLAGNVLHILDAVNGNELSSCNLPSSSESRPVVVSRNGSPAVVYAFSDWEAGLVTVENDGAKLTTVSEVDSPVYADLLSMDHRVIACDISGCIHEVNLETLQVKSTKVCSSPIFSGPVQKSNSLVFGCHDGVVRCVCSTDVAKVLWQYDAKAVVYSKVCLLANNHVVVCTTAGDVVLVKEGIEQRRYRVGAEVWSDPVVHFQTLAFGARDSRLHVVNIPIQL